MIAHQGLTTSQVEILRAERGWNVLPRQHQQTIVGLFLSQFTSPLVFVLVVVSVITLFMRELSDTVVILLVIVFNACIGTFQEFKALHSLQSLKELLTPKTKVYRDGQLVVLDAAELVPGDIVSLEAGDRVPADGSFLEAQNMTVNQAQLTGEAYPVEKNSHDQTDIAMGTLVASGRGVMKVEKIGEATALGQISKNVADYMSEPTPLEKQLAGVLRGVLIIVLSACGLLFLIGIVEKIPLEALFKTIVSLAVSAIPEGLPIVVTVTLAVGALRMSQKKAILRNLPSVSTLAGIDVICTDKTGTLTAGKIVLDKLLRFSAGSFSQTRSKELLQLAVLCNDAHLGNQDIGDLLDISLLRAAVNQGLSTEQIRSEAPRVAEMPFESQQRWQATLHQLDKERLLIVKGAPDFVLSRSTHLNNRSKIIIEERVHHLTRQGLRVLAIAQRKSKYLQLGSYSDVKDLTFEGLLVFSDQLRPDAVEAIKRCHDAGIQVIMVTGDHLNTALSVAHQLGLDQKSDTAILGERLHDFTHSLENLTVVARATPFDKTTLIDHLKAEQKLVAMTGDGVNDAPALVRADIGIAMGKSGSDAAREAADMVLVDDAFSTIVDGISVARGIFENIRKVISYLFTTSYGEIGVIFIALILGFPLPLLATQVLWMNLITDGLLDISISTEPIELNIMKKNHLRYKGPIIDKLLLLRIVLLGTVMSVGTVVIFMTQLVNGLAYARTAALIVLVLFQWFHAFNSRHETQSIAEIGVFTNKAVITAVVFEVILLVLAVYHPFFQLFLHTVPVKFEVWMVAIAMSSVVLFVEEIRKAVFRQFQQLATTHHLSDISQ